MKTNITCFLSHVESRKNDIKVKGDYLRRRSRGAGGGE
jgi:hypothetical protein